MYTVEDELLSLLVKNQVFVSSSIIIKVLGTINHCICRISNVFNNFTSSVVYFFTQMLDLCPNSHEVRFCENIHYNNTDPFFSGFFNENYTIADSPWMSTERSEFFVSYVIYMLIFVLLFSIPHACCFFRIV